MSAPAIPLSFRANLTPILPTRTRYNYNHRICFAFSPSNSSISSADGDSQEEARWLREEQRWLREEQRWLREESRWNKEKEALLLEIHKLKSQNNVAESLNFVQENNIPKVLQLKERSSSAQPIVLKTKTTKDQEGTILKDVIEVSQQQNENNVKKKRSTLRIGSEGEEVKSMQEALEKLGFYSGEEDTEFSSFSSGTERAVKTWQSTLGAPEDGIMTTELLGVLFEEKLDTPSFTAPKIQEKVADDYRDEHHRVYLIGENRWEDPSKLSSRKNPSGSNGQVSRSSACMSCRGEGRVVCMECEGSGEPNIEPQFVEWIGEGAQCAYCDGLGYVTCDVCM